MLKILTLTLLLTATPAQFRSQEDQRFWYEQQQSQRDWERQRDIDDLRDQLSRTPRIVEPYYNLGKKYDYLDYELNMPYPDYPYRTPRR